jgi:molybdate transport system ATP-binding protein
MSLVFRNVHLRLGDMALELDATLGKKVTALFGTSSSGKTYLLELTAGLRRPEQGVIELDGVTLANIATDQCSREAAGHRLRFAGPRTLSASFHAPKHRLWREKAVFSPPGNLPRETLPRVGYRTLLDRRPDSLSGGEKQRVAFARALLASPQLLLLDEPLASLDQSLKDRIMPYLKRIRDEFAIPMLYVTHSPAEVVALCEDVVVLQSGKCVAHGKPHDVFAPSDATLYRMRED